MMTPEKLAYIREKEKRLGELRAEVNRLAMEIRKLWLQECSGEKPR